jgi:hypothetical protein
MWIMFLEAGLALALLLLIAGCAWPRRKCGEPRDE